jgi:IclR family pca regulon transcriptional regulator
LDRDVIQSIERGFAVLLAFDADLPSATLAQVSSRTGLSRPAVRRILITLNKLGYVTSDGPRWSLAPRVLTIGQHYAAANGIVQISQPHLLRLAERTGESASLAQLDGAEIVYVARVNVRRVLSLTVDIGTRLPAHATSMGRVLAAFAEASVVDRIVAESGLRALTRHTITDPIRFRDALHEVRRRGYAIVDSELEEGFLTAATPVRDVHGVVIAALAYSTSSSRRSVEEVEREVIPVLLEVAADISRDVALLAERSRTIPLDARDGFF